MHQRKVPFSLQFIRVFCVCLCVWSRRASRSDLQKSVMKPLPQRKTFFFYFPWQWGWCGRRCHEGVLRFRLLVLPGSHLHCAHKKDHNKTNKHGKVVRQSWEEEVQGKKNCLCSVPLPMKKTFKRQILIKKGKSSVVVVVVVVAIAFALVASHQVSYTIRV